MDPINHFLVNTPYFTILNCQKLCLLLEECSTPTSEFFGKKLILCPHLTRPLYAMFLAKKINDKIKMCSTK